MALRESLPPGQVIDVQFADFMRDPFATIRSLYGRLDRELTPTAEQRMRDHLAAHPGDGGGGRYAGRTPVSTPASYANRSGRTRTATECRPNR